MRLLLFLLVAANEANSLKFLAYSTQFSASHVNFIARISDVLVDAGHEVVLVSPIMNSQIGGAMARKARVIEIPQCDQAKEFDDHFNAEMSQNVWAVKHPVQMFTGRQDAFATWGHVCNSVVADNSLMEQLKAEKFEAAFAETFDFCGPVLFHLLEIDKWAVTESLAVKDGSFHVTQTPSFPSYVPSMMSGAGEAMSFSERVANTISFSIMHLFLNVAVPTLDEVLKKGVPDLPPINDLMATNSLVFFNSEPFVDFPRVTSARIIDIGGIAVSSGSNPLNHTWSSILDLHPKTILISFGTVAKSSDMPDEYKQTFRETFLKFPDVTFIWKYEKPEHRMSEGISNLIEATWVPQRDMLYDPRVSAFITHCGQASTTEAIDGGIPMIVIPVVGDGERNAYQVERNGIGLRLAKTDLANAGKLEEAIRETLKTESYHKNARKVRSLVSDRPFPMKEIFVKNMEFLAKHGPLRQLDHYGRHLNFVQYYLIDVIVFLVSIAVVTVVLFVLGIRWALKRVFSRKSKQD